MGSPRDNQLCLECGLCCNGVIFAHGQLQPEEDAAHLQSLGLRLVSPRPLNRREPAVAVPARGLKFHQPCGAFDGCRCGIYPDRPQYCRQFDCRLLQSVQTGRTTPEAAVRTVRTARRKVDQVKRLFHQLGDTQEQLALGVRFRKLQQRMEKNIPDDLARERFGELTLAVHGLNVLLNDAFYPGSVR
jgi:hypothetical protein